MARVDNVAHLITRLDLGGAQQNTLYCVEHHDRTRFRSFLLSGPGGLLDDEARQIPDATVLFVPQLRHPIAPWHDCQAVLGLAAVLRRLQIDLVHTHCSKAGIVGRAAARLAGVRVVVHTAHGWSFNPTQGVVRRSLFLLLERLAARHSDLLVTVSECDRLRGLRLGIGEPDQYRLIRSGIDLAWSGQRPPQRLLQRRAGEVAIGTIACFKPQKDLLTLLRAARRVLEKVPGARFYLAGDGEQRELLERTCRELGIAERVELLGWVRDVRAFLHDLDLFVLTSRFEGLPRSLLQAVAARVPIVATAVDGIPEVVVDGCSGLLTEPGDDGQIADHLVRLSGDEALRRQLASAALERISAGTFEIKSMLAELEQCYEQLLAARPGR